MSRRSPARRLLLLAALLFVAAYTLAAHIDPRQPVGVLTGFLALFSGLARLTHKGRDTHA